VSEITIKLANEVTDTTRKKAITNLAPMIEEDFCLYVEGSIDMILFKKLYPDITVQMGGIKEDVITKVTNQRNTIGIVDMDADFDSLKVKNSLRIMDTKPHCCIFAKISEIFSVENYYNSLKSKYGEKWSEFRVITPDITQNNENIRQMLQSMTNSRLYRNYISNQDRKLEMDYEKLSPSWKIMNDKPEIYNQNIYLNYKQDAEKLRALEFAKEFSQQLRNVSINDHSFEEVIGSLFSSEFSKKENFEGRSFPRLDFRKSKRFFKKYFKSVIIENIQDLTSFIPHIDKFVLDNKKSFSGKSENIEPL
tara:strand:+ start:276 stop:1196 length:921 start_codon:yes stop_codon:yes gene_type:complete